MRALLVVVCLGSALASVEAASAPRQGRSAMVSLVVLSNTHVELTVDVLRGQLDELYPGHFLPPRAKGTFVVEGTAPGEFLIQSMLPGAAGMFLLHSVRAPYSEFSDFARFIRDRSLRQKAQAQCCWLPGDLIHRHTTDEDAYRLIGHVLAKLAPPDAAFLVHPEKRTAIVFDDKVR